MAASKKFKPGFRLSTLDILVIVSAIAGALYFFNIAKPLSAIIAMVVMHFFVFCNVTRMSRIPELIWAFVFTLLTILSLRFNLLPLYLVFIISISLSVTLIALELRKRSYHGILWQKINPNLEAWFRENNEKN